MSGDLWQARESLDVATGGFSVHEVTPRILEWVADQGAKNGLLTVFIRHTSASLIIMENADPDVMADLMDSLARLAPEEADYRHSTEGPDDMPAHIRTALTQTHLSVPITDGRLDLGLWQGIWLMEHRRQRQVRQLVLHYMGE